MDELFWRAVLGAAVLGAVAGPIGCFVLWRRMAYVGASIAEMAPVRPDGQHRVLHVKRRATHTGSVPRDVGGVRARFVANYEIAAHRVAGTVAFWIHGNDLRPPDFRRWKFPGWNTVTQTETVHGQVRTRR